MKLSSIVPFFVVVLLISCQQEHRKVQLLANAKWLVGNWQNRSEKGVLIESWKQLDDSTMVGKSYFIAGADTLSMENIRMEQRNGALAYIPIVRDQNNGQAVYFTLTSSTDSTLVFENPEHDFPRKITYRYMKNDSLVAEVSAITDGKIRTQTFRMGKTKD